MAKTFLFFLGISGLALMVWFFGPEAVGGTLSAVSLKSIALLFLLQSATLACSAWIWHFLLNRKGNRISFGQVFLINQAAGLVESLTPSVKFGGEAAKVYLFRQKTGESYQSLTGTLLVHKFVTMAPFAVLCALLSIPAVLFFDLPVVFLIALLFLIAMCAGLAWACYSVGTDQADCKENTAHETWTKLSAISKTIQGWQDRFAAFIHQARHSAGTLLSAGETIGVLAMSAAIWFFYPVKVFLACYFLGLEVHPIIIGMATLFAYMVNMAPLSPGGLGTYEGTMAMFLTIGGLSPAEGLAVSILSRLVTFWFPLALSGLSCLFLLRESPVFAHVKPNQAME